MELLELISFNENTDTLWFTGDLINRGSKSANVMSFITNLKSKVIAVLGNHDLHFLSIAMKCHNSGKNDTFNDLLYSKHLDNFIQWFRNRPLLHYDLERNIVMTHAGIYPLWTLDQAKQYATEIENILKDDSKVFYALTKMYCSKHCVWDSNSEGIERIRFIINAFTRMRYCDKNGMLNLKCDSPVGTQPEHLIPWFLINSYNNVANNLNKTKIIFGHWASLSGKTNLENVICLDTGCCWGYKLSAYAIETNQFYVLNCCAKL
jgi:bis(5'-nucleosyl)-tetraphosphatase (symmetrical)